MLISLYHPINDFRDLNNENIALPILSTDKIKDKINSMFPKITWSIEGEHVFFGCAPCEEKNTMEIWIMEKPFFSVKVTAMVEDVVEIAKKLNMTAIDMQKGKIVYGQQK